MDNDQNFQYVAPQQAQAQPQYVQTQPQYVQTQPQYAQTQTQPELESAPKQAQPFIITSPVASVPTSVPAAQTAKVDSDALLLPIGYTDSEGTVHKTFKLRPVTGEAEEAMGDAKVRENGAKVITEYIYAVLEKLGTIPHINKDIVRGLTATDRDYILLRSYIYSNNKSILSYTAHCPFCRERNTVNVDLSSLPVAYKPDGDNLEYTIELPVGYRDGSGNLHKTATIVYPTGAMQERIAPLVRTNPAVATTTFLTMLIKKLGTLDFINPDIVRKMSVRDRNYIGEYIPNLKYGVDFGVETPCASCSQMFTSQIPVESLLGE